MLLQLKNKQIITMQYTEKEKSRNVDNKTQAIRALRVFVFAVWSSAILGIF